MDYQETEYTIASWSVSVTRRTEPFKKEHAAAGKVVRGTLDMGSSDNSLPFVWQREEGKLFLDLNRNQDLTDDPTGVFSSPVKSRNYQSFTKIRLPATIGEDRCEVLANIDLWDYSQRPGCNLTIRSFWQGKVTLHGQDWQIGVIPGSSYEKGGKNSISFENGHLLVRPWAKRNQSFNSYSGSVAVVPFTRKLFLDGHAYQLDWTTQAQKGGLHPTIQFTEQNVEMGELNITGKYIQRLILAGKPYLVVLDRPSGVVKVPVGDYSQPSIRLEQGGTEAYYDADRWANTQRFRVTAKSPAKLAIGGPLTNTVSVTRRGQDLYMDYRLVGVGGMTYQAANQGANQAPEFVVFKADKKIASGKFEFG
jgi:hypothetical protein